MGEAGAVGGEGRRGGLWLGSCKHPSQLRKVISQGKAVCAMLRAGEVFGRPCLSPRAGAKAFWASALSFNLSAPPSWVWTETSLLAWSFWGKQA